MKRMASIKSSGWTGNFTEDDDLRTAELRQKVMEEYARRAAQAQQSSIIGTTASPPWASVVKDDSYYKKVAEELTKLVYSAECTGRDNYARAIRAETELASYKNLIPWLMMNHPEYLEEFNVFLKAKARLEVEE